MFYHENKSTLRACDNDMSALLLQLVPVTAVAYDKPNILTNPSVAEFFLKFFLSRLCRYTIPGVRMEFFYIYIYTCLVQAQNTSHTFHTRSAVKIQIALLERNSFCNSSL